MGVEPFFNPASGSHPTHSHVHGPLRPETNMYDGVKSIAPKDERNYMHRGQWQRRSVCPLAGESYRNAYRDSIAEDSAFPARAVESESENEWSKTQNPDIYTYENTRNWLPSHQTTQGALQFIDGVECLTAEAVRVPASFHMRTSPDIHYDNSANHTWLADQRETHIEEAQRKFNVGSTRKLPPLPDNSSMVLLCQKKPLTSRFTGLTTNVSYGQFDPTINLTNISRGGSKYCRSDPTLTSRSDGGHPHSSELSPIKRSLVARSLLSPKYSRRNPIRNAHTKMLF